MAKRVPVPIPLNGLNTVSPDLPLEAGFARELTNFSLVNGRLRMRPANLNYARYTLSTLFNYYTLWYDELYAIISTGDIKRLSDSVTVGAITAPFLFPMPSTVKHVSLNYVIGVAEPRLIDYPFTAWTFTTIGITAINITSACSHKGRLYVSDGTTIEYSNVGQITGAMYDAFDVSEFMDGQEVLRIFTCTIGSGNSNADNVFVIFGDAGKVLVYQGDYPASSTWNLIGNYDMSAPQSGASFLEIDGDIWVSADRYAYWFSVLFSEGVQGAQAGSPTRAVENIWQNQQFVLTFTSPRNSTCYLPSLDAIMVNFGAFDPSYTVAGYFTSSSFVNVSRGILVYFRKYNAWAIWYMPPFDWPIREMEDSNGTPWLYGIRNTAALGSLAGYINRISYTTNYGTDLTSSNPVNTYQDIVTSWKTPFINAFVGKLQKVCGVRPFFQSSLNGFLNKLRLIFDYSDYNAPFGFYTQPAAPAQINPGNYADAQVDVPTTTWDNYSPYVSVSGIGGGVSLQVTMQPKAASANEQLNEIYAATLYIEDGGDMI